MDNLPKKCRRSLFDSFIEEINNEESVSDLPNHEEPVRMCDSNSSTDDTNLNEHDDCERVLKAFDDAFETIYGDSKVSFIQVQQISKELQTNCVNMINAINTQSQLNQEYLVEIEQLKSKYNLLENESLTTINKLQSEITKLNLRLKRQSSLSYFIGSTLCRSLGKATQIPSAVDMVLQEDNITNMVKLITNILSSFIKTYYKRMPPINTNETKFVLCILRIVANLTQTKNGCYFFSQVKDGINIVNLIVSLVLCTPPSLDILKKISYTTLLNVSNEFNGHFLMENNTLIQILNNDIKVVPTNTDNSIILFSLKLLLSLSRKMNKSMYIIFKNEINLQEILKLTKYTETELPAREIFENINIASEKYNDKSE